MKIKGNPYKINFEIKNLSMIEQEKVFKAVLNVLDYDAKENFHIVVTDFMGGQHFVWDNSGIDPNGVKCRSCKLIDCENCPVFIKRKEFAEKSECDAYDDEC